MKFIQFFVFLGVALAACSSEEDVTAAAVTLAEFSSEDVVEALHNVADAVEIEDEVANCDVTPMTTNTDNPSDWVHIPAGNFVMGCIPERDGECENDELSARCITISKPFEMMRTEVTRRMFRDAFGDEILENIASSFDAYCAEDNCPMTSMSWTDGILLANVLSEQEGLEPAYTIENFDLSSYWEDEVEERDARVTWNREANGYRLPTEAEWRYAARGGENYRYAGSNDILEVAWINANSPDGPQPVGQKKPNGVGLYDMTGNQWEWVWDISHGYEHMPYENISSIDPSGPTEVIPIGPQGAPARRDCGGAWNDTGELEEEAALAAIVRRNNTLLGSAYEPMGHRLIRPIDP